MDNAEVKRVPPEKNRGGVWVQFGDEEYRVPSLAFLAVKEQGPNIDSLQKIVGFPTAEQAEAVVSVVHAAIVRNYPSMQLDQVRDMLDFSNFMPVMDAVMNVSGFKRAAPGEAQAR